MKYGQCDEDVAIGMVRSDIECENRSDNEKT